MAARNASRHANRARIEALLRIAAPALDLLLAVGDRASRIVSREDVEYYPPRVASDEPRSGRP